MAWFYPRDQPGELPDWPDFTTALPIIDDYFYNCNEIENGSPGRGRRYYFCWVCNKTEALNRRTCFQHNFQKSRILKNVIFFYFRPCLQIRSLMLNLCSSHSQLMLTCVVKDMLLPANNRKRFVFSIFRAQGWMFWRELVPSLWRCLNRLSRAADPNGNSTFNNAHSPRLAHSPRHDW